MESDAPVMDRLVREFIVGAPLGKLLGMTVEALEPGKTTVRLSYRPEITTYGDVIHGGTIASLIDIAATAAVWHGSDPEKVRRGTTVGFTVNYLSAARGQDLLAEARVLQRGKSLCVCRVDVSGVDGTAVACGQLTYKIN